MYYYTEDDGWQTDYSSAGTTLTSANGPGGSKSASGHYTFERDETAVSHYDDTGLVTERGGTGYAVLTYLGNGSASFSGSGGEDSSSGSGPGVGPGVTCTRHDEWHDQQSADYNYSGNSSESYDPDGTIALREAEDGTSGTQGNYTTQADSTTTGPEGTTSFTRVEHNITSSFDNWHYAGRRGRDGWTWTRSRTYGGDHSYDWTATFTDADGQATTTTGGSVPLPPSGANSTTLTHGTPPADPQPPTYTGPSTTAYSSLVDAVLGQANTGYNQPANCSTATDAAIAAFTGVDADANGQGDGAVYEQVNTPPSGGSSPGPSGTQVPRSWLPPNIPEDAYLKLTKRVKPPPPTCVSRNIPPTIPQRPCPSIGADTRSPTQRYLDDLLARAQDEKLAPSDRAQAVNEYLEAQYQLAPISPAKRAAIDFFAPRNYQPGIGGTSLAEQTVIGVLGAAAGVRAGFRAPSAPPNAPSGSTETARSTSPGYWWRGRYSTAASQPGAYQASGGRVFPTRRNSGLEGDALRAAQEAFTRIKLLEGNPADVVRGQAREAGLTVLDNNGRLADPGAESAIQRAINWYNNLPSNGGYR